MKRALISLLTVAMMLSVLSGCGEDTKQGAKHETITLEANNEYFIISDVDTSECVYEDGYFSGTVYFNAHTTQKYVDTYAEYVDRQVFFGFYNDEGDLVGEESKWVNYLYDRDYTGEESIYVMVSSHKPISAVKVTRIEIVKP